VLLQVLQKLEKVLAKEIGVDVVLSEQTILELIDSLRLLDQRPDSRPHWVEPVIDTLVQVQDGCLAIQVAGDLLLDRHDGR